MQEHPLTHWPIPDVNRRDFVVTALAAGFALSVRPVSAETITTDTKGLEAGEVKIPVTDGEIPAYRAMPTGGGPFPLILVVQEIFGVHEHIKDICRRLAKLGYLAIAPEHQQNEYGRQLMEHVENALRARGCAKLNLQVRTSNAAALGFYARLGYVHDQVVSLGKRLIVDDSEGAPAH